MSKWELIRDLHQALDANQITHQRHAELLGRIERGFDLDDVKRDLESAKRSAEIMKSFGYD